MTAYCRACGYNGGSRAEDPPLNQRSFSLFPPARFPPALSLSLCLLVASLAGQPAGSPLTLLSREGRRTVPVALVGDQEFVALDDLAGAFQLDGPGGSRRGDRVVPRPEHRADAEPGARLGGRAAGLAAGAADPLGQPLAGAGRIHQPRARADLRYAPRSAAASRGWSSSATFACRGLPSPSTTRLPRHALHLRRHSGDSERDLAGDRDGSSIRFEADALDVSLPPATAQGLVQAAARDRALVYRHRSRPALRVVPGVDPDDRKHARLDSRRARRGGRNLESARRRRRRRPSRRHRRNLPVFGQPATPFGPSRSTRATAATMSAHAVQGGTVEKDLTLAVARRVKAALEARLGHARADDARRRSQRPAESADLAGQQQQGGRLHQPSRERVARCRPRPAPQSTWPASRIRSRRRRRCARAGAGVRRRFARHRAACCGTSRRSATSNSPPSCRASSRRRCASAARFEVRPMERAPFRVLESANMPAVLIEMGFLTNPAQEKAAGGRRVSDRLRPERARRHRPVPRPSRRGRR